MSMNRQNCQSAGPSRESLLNRINEVSFAVNDAALFLDTHPNDASAMAFFCENMNYRKEALAEYAKYFGPLTMDTANDSGSASWEWIEQPFPWEEKGVCR